MSAARDQVLSAIRKATAAGTGGPEAVADRLDAHAANVRPNRAAEDETVVERFKAEAARAGTDIHTVPSLDDLPDVIAAYLREHNLSGEVRVSDDPLVADVPWDNEALISVTRGPAEPGDTASLSVPFAGVAETGTIMMRSSRENPAMMNYLPLVHIAVLSESRIVGGYETAWAKVRKDTEPGRQSSRMINLITGPSRTADIEQELLMGAHGPQKHMVVILSGE